jgi:predicted Zn-dependent peptidase
VLEGTLREPDEVLAGLDAVTIEDIQRVALDIIREDRLNFALIGPFDDPERFQKLLAFSA